MKISEKEKQSVVEKLTAFIDQEGKATRARILDGTAKLYGLSEKELANKSPNSKNGLLRSYIGTALNDLVASGDVAKQNDEYFLTKEKLIVVGTQQCKKRDPSFTRTKSDEKEGLVFRVAKPLRNGSNKVVEG